MHDPQKTTAPCFKSEPIAPIALEFCVFIFALVGFIATTFAPSRPTHSVADLMGSLLNPTPTLRELISIVAFIGIILTWLPIARRLRTNPAAGVWIGVAALLGSFAFQSLTLAART